MNQGAESSKKMKIGVLILAAGRSSRMGRPKQTIPWGGKLLIRHVADVATALSSDPVLVVTGAYAQEVTEALKGSAAACHYCPHWEEGMASSLQSGLQRLMIMCPDMKAVLLLLGDQPMVNTSFLETLILTFKVQSPIFVASAYAGSIGPPVVLARTLFPALLELRGDRGAKHLLETYREQGIFLPFEPGSVDLDTPEDILTFKQ